MRTVLIAGAAALATMSAVPSMAATNLLTNGSFEGGFANFSTLLSGNGESPQSLAYNSSSYGLNMPPDDAVSASPDAAGGKFLFFVGDNVTQTLTQQVSLLAGKTYQFGFSYRVTGTGNPVNSALTAGLGNSTIGAVSNGSGDTWRAVSTTYVSTLAQTLDFTLRFQTLSSGIARDISIDRAYVIDATPAAPPAAVPEPATWGTMLLGFGIAGAALRVRRRGAALRA